MLKKKTAENKIHARSAPGRVLVTTGEAFSDGVAIELVSGSAGTTRPDLLLWNGSTANVSATVRHGAMTFVAPKLDLSLYGAMRLPQNCTDHVSVSRLFSQIAALFEKHLCLPDRDSRLLTAFALSTWLADRLPMAAGLVISAPEVAHGIDILRLLGCVCRRALLLAEVTLAGLRSLPMQLGITLLINQQEIRPSLQRLLQASAYRGFHCPGNGGKVVDIFGPKAILCGSDDANILGEGVLKISIAPSQRARILNLELQNQIANQLQPQLLHYRLQYRNGLHNSEFELRDFTSAMQPLARTFSECLRGDPDLARDTVGLLKVQDQEIREKTFLDVNHVLLEILWGVIHEGKRDKIQVEQLAVLVNTTLHSRGGRTVFSAEELGWVMKRMGIRKHSSSSGRQVVFSDDNCDVIHRAAAGYGLQCAEKTHDGCNRCQSLRAVGAAAVM